MSVGEPIGGGHDGRPSSERSSRWRRSEPSSAEGPRCLVLAATPVLIFVFVSILASDAIQIDRVTTLYAASIAGSFSSSASSSVVPGSSRMPSAAKFSNGAFITSFSHRHVGSS